MACVRPSITDGPIVFILLLNDTITTSSSPARSSTHARTASVSNSVLP